MCSGYCKLSILIRGADKDLHIMKELAVMILKASMKASNLYSCIKNAMDNRELIVR